MNTKPISKILLGNNLYHLSFSIYCESEVAITLKGGKSVTKIQVSKKALVLFLLWLRGPLKAILSFMILLSFVGLAIVSISASLLTTGWTKEAIRLMISFFVSNFCCFLIILYYDKIIQRLS